ncbi:MAG: phosphatase PAP2 family protein [Crocinitomicaceae bacterium]|nr:phosphatase PAP2 family protein [Crocinitomicaceae bacterium]
MEYFFKAVSYILHPFFMTLLGLFVLFESPTIPNSYYLYDALYFFPQEAKTVLYIVLGILTLFAPGLSLLIMYWNKMVSSLDLKKREERIMPFILVTFYYILAYIYLRVQIPEYLQHPALMSFIFGIILVFVVSFIINLYIKLSLHAAAIFGVCGMLLAYNQTQIESNLAFLLYLLFVGGLVASSRIYLQAHTLKETLIGMVVGFGVLFISVKFHIYY